MPLSLFCRLKQSFKVSFTSVSQISLACVCIGWVSNRQNVKFLSTVQLLSVHIIDISTNNI